MRHMWIAVDLGVCVAHQRPLGAADVAVDRHQWHPRWPVHRRRHSDAGVNREKVFIATVLCFVAPAGDHSEPVAHDVRLLLGLGRLIDEQLEVFVVYLADQFTDLVELQVEAAQDLYGHQLQQVTAHEERLSAIERGRINEPTFDIKSHLLDLNRLVRRRAALFAQQLFRVGDQLLDREALGAGIDRSAQRKFVRHPHPFDVLTLSEDRSRQPKEQLRSSLPTQEGRGIVPPMITHIDATSHVRARHWLALSAAVVLISFGCSDGAGGFFGNVTGKPVGSGCDPNTTEEACYKQVRVKCDPGTNRYVQLEVCPNGTTCKERVHPVQKTKREAVCDGTPTEGPADADIQQEQDVEAEEDIETGGADKDDPVCKRWLSDHANLTEGTFSGDLETCKQGDLDAEGRARVLKVLNMYRYIASLPEVTTDDALDKKAQRCAELMGANNDISHTPPKDWKCWTQDGADAAKDSNLSTAPAILAVDRYMVDEGPVNKPTMGHRRWMLGKELGPVGIGSTNDTVDAKGQASCLWIKGKGTAKYEWMAWPPSGKMPHKAMWPHESKGHSSVDQTGWTLQSDDIDFSKATIKVKAGISELKVKVRQLKPNIATKYAIAFTPDGWKSEQGTTYQVDVGGIDKPFTYFVQMLDCE
jgi:hypothetical protein